MTNVVAIARGEDRFALIDEVAERTGFWHRLEERRAVSGKSAEEYRVAIKPNLMIFQSRDVPEVATDPAMVEHLIHRLRERGYRRIQVVEAQNTMGNWVRNRSVKNVARVAGYSGQGYEIVDLTEDRVRHVYRVQGLPAWDHWVGRAWRDADFRIDFAKFKTQLDNNFTLCLKNEFGVLPFRNKYLHYHTRRPFWACTLYTLVSFPVHFGFIDGYVASDGALGFAVQYQPKLLKLVMAGSDILALDLVGARLMGVDPYEAPIPRFAMRHFGIPKYHVDGDDGPLVDWENVPELLHDIADVGQALYLLANTGAMMGILNLDTKEFPPRFSLMRWYYKILNTLMLWLNGRRMPHTDKKLLATTMQTARTSKRV